jgi:hypothetical protein
MAKKSNSITNEPVKTFPEKITQRLTQIHSESRNSKPMAYLLIICPISAT